MGGPASADKAGGERFQVAADPGGDKICKKNFLWQWMAESTFFGALGECQKYFSPDADLFFPPKTCYLSWHFAGLGLSLSVKKILSHDIKQKNPQEE